MKMPLAPAAFVVVIMAAILLPLIASCAGDGPEAPGLGAGRTPIPTTVPAQTRAMGEAFLREYQGVSQEWDQMDAALDQWRAGLTACDRAVGQRALDGFAARANQITQGTLKLPRQAVLRDLADQVNQASEKQEAAMRQLRDGWQPANPASYETVEAEGAAAARMWLEAQDGLDDLRIQVAPSSQAAVGEFSSGLQSVNAVWDRVHQNFDSSRTQTGSDAVDRLNVVMVGMSEVVTGIRGLPNSPAGSRWAWSLAEAANGEEQVLRRLRDPALSSSAKEAAVAAVDARIASSNAVRGRVQRQVASVLNTPEDNRRGVADFATQLGDLSQSWDKLQQDYHRWRNGADGCNVTNALQALDQLVIRSAALAGRAQRLPSASLLRSLQEPLAEAATRQAEAIKTLRAEWRPYATDLYRALDQERRAATDRRRQVAAGVQELPAKLGIPAPAP